MEIDERKFLHDLSNPLAIGYGNVKILSSKLQKNPDALDKGDIIARLEKALTAFDRVNKLISDRRHDLLKESDHSVSASEKAV